MLGPTRLARGSTRLVHDLVETLRGAGDIVQSDDVGAAMLSLRAFMFERVYLGPETRREHDRAHEAIAAHLRAPRRARRLADAIVEFIAGMTDRFALVVR